MKKGLAYATLAVVLGIAVMLAPVMMSTVIPISKPDLTGGAYAPERSLSPQSFGTIAKQSESSAGIVPNFPADVLTVTMILLFSLALAFSAYFYVRRS